VAISIERETKGTAGVRRQLQAMARLQSRLHSLRAELDEQVRAVRARYQGRLDACEVRLARMRERLEGTCRTERDAVLARGQKSLRTPFGEVGFRSSRASVRLRDGVDEDEACRLLRAGGLSRFVRLTESPDRAGIGGAVRQGELPPVDLPGFGLEYVEGKDRFYCKVWSAMPGNGGRAS